MTHDYAQAAKTLLDEQRIEWDLCGDNYKGLEKVEFRTFDYDGFTIKVQFNPGRIVSTSAKVDEKSIKNRKCFLCKENLPAEQRGIPFKDKYSILCNPFPIFPEHFTLPSMNHEPQLIDGELGSFLDFTEALGSRYLVFYNGPKCGASAPDHLHFQAGLKNFLPVVTEFESISQRYGSLIYGSNGVAVTAIDDGIRKMIVLEGKDKDLVEKEWEKVYSAYEKRKSPGEDEPLLNILGTYSEGGYRIILFLRAKHRPDRYFAEGDERLMLSPASVDLGGICVLPIENDFRKITKEELKELLQEVFVNGSYLREITEELKRT